MSDLFIIAVHGAAGAYIGWNGMAALFKLCVAAGGATGRWLNRRIGS